jgi:hypothetical protein
MNTDFGSWLLGMSLGASALGGMLGMAIGMFIMLAATTWLGAALCNKRFRLRRPRGTALSVVS